MTYLFKNPDGLAKMAADNASNIFRNMDRNERHKGIKFAYRFGAVFFMAVLTWALIVFLYYIFMLLRSAN